MKTYEKPRLIVLSLSGNEQLCGSCADKNGHTLNDDLSLAQFLMTFFGIPDVGSNGPDRKDFENVFGNESQCRKNDESIIIDSYCKFTSTGTMVAWS